MITKQYKFFTIQGDAVLGRKTKLFVIYDRGNSVLGRVLWYAGWRQYVFEPNVATIWSTGCLADVMKFMGELNKEHRTCQTTTVNARTAGRR